jgi:hypothetical protein
MNAEARAAVPVEKSRKTPIIAPGGFRLARPAAKAKQKRP